MVLKMLEAQVEDWSVNRARQRGWFVRKFTSPYRRSAPDDIFAKQGYTGERTVFFIEFKATGCKPTVLQAEEHSAMRSAGLNVYVCDSRELFEQIMRIESKRINEDWVSRNVP